MVCKLVSRRSIALLLTSIALAAGAGGCASLDEWQRKTIFSPMKGEQRWHREPLAGTEEYDLPLGDHTIRVWYTPAARADAPTVLYLHGARWNLNGSVFRIERWVEMGYNVLAIDYRGFGQSTEIVPSEESVYEDARVAFGELARRQPDPSKRLLYGHSLGGAVALDLAARNGPDEAISAVVVESTFTSMPAVIKGLRWGWVPGIDFAITQRFDSLSKVTQVDEPLLVIHGTADRLVPDSMADELHAAAGSPVKRLVKLEGASHSGTSRHPGYAEAVLDFLRTAASGGSRAAALSAPSPTGFR